MTGVISQEKDNKPGERLRCHTDSISQDIIFSKQDVKFLTAKHSLLVCGIHSITGLYKAAEQDLVIRVFTKKYGEQKLRKPS